MDNTGNSWWDYKTGKPPAKFLNECSCLRTVQFRGNSIIILLLFHIIIIIKLILICGQRPERVLVKIYLEEFSRLWTWQILDLDWSQFHITEVICIQDCLSMNLAQFTDWSGDIQNMIINKQSSSWIKVGVID